MIRVLLAAAAFALLAAAPVAAQQPRTATFDTVAISPAGAFARSLVVPGWGHAALGHTFRGGVYFTAQTGSWFMLLRTIGRLNDARRIEDRRVAYVEQVLADSAAVDSVFALRLEDPAQRRALIGADARVRNARKVVGAREEQREDWAAWVIFWTLAGAADALVVAHLADFPVDVVAAPGRDGRWTVSASVPVGRGR